MYSAEEQRCYCSAGINVSCANATFYVTVSVLISMVTCFGDLMSGYRTFRNIGDLKWHGIHLKWTVVVIGEGFHLNHLLIGK